MDRQKLKRQNQCSGRRGGEHVDWDTDDAQDRSCTPSPSVGIGAIMLGESTEDTPPARQNIRLVTEHVIEPGVVPPQENAPEAEDKSPDDGDDAPSDEQQPKLGCEGDIVDLYAGTRRTVGRSMIYLTT